MLTVLDQINSEVQANAGSEASRALILRMVLDSYSPKYFDWISSVDRQLILRGRHPSYPDLVELTDRNEQLKRQLQGIEMHLRHWFHQHADGCHAALVLSQKQIIAQRQELRTKIKLRILEILGPNAFRDVRRCGGMYMTAAEARTAILQRQGKGFSYQPMSPRSSAESEHWFPKPAVAGSNPAGDPISYGDIKSAANDPSGTGVRFFSYRLLDPREPPR